MKTTSLATKLVILVLFALAFGATMIALSVKHPQYSYDDGHSWDSGKKFEKKYSIQPGGLLILDADVGDITINGGDKDELSAVVTARGSENHLEKYHVSFDQDGNTVRIKGEHERKFFHFFDGGSFDVHYEIQLPKNFNLELQTSGGNLEVFNVDGNIKGETSGGDVKVEDVSGTVKLSTSGGNVTLDNSKGDLALETSGGDIKGSGLSGTIDLQTSGGNIVIKNSDGKLSASTSGGDIRVDLKDNKGINLSTSGGSITVRLPRSVSAEVDASTTGGDVSCDFPFQGRIKDGSMRGKINGGGNLIQAETSGGDIIINSD